MKIAVLGTGMVGRALAGRLTGLGHDVTIGTRDPQATLARTEPDGMGNPPFSPGRRPTRRSSWRPSPRPRRGAELRRQRDERATGALPALERPAPTTSPAR